MVMKRTTVSSGSPRSSAEGKKRKPIARPQSAHPTAKAALVAKSASTRALQRLTALLAQVEPSSGARFVLAHHLKGKYRKKLLALLGKASPSEAAATASLRKDLASTRSEWKHFRNEVHDLRDSVEWLMDHIPLAFLVLDHEMKIRWCSAAVEEVLQISVHECGKRLSRVKVRACNCNIGEIAAETLKTGVMQQCELTGANGKRYVLHAERVAETSKGQRESVILTFADVEVQRRDLRGVRVLRDREKRFLDVSSGLVVELDAQQKVIRMNREGMEITGYSDTDVPGKDWVEDFVPEGLRDVWREAIGPLLQGERESCGLFEMPVRIAGGEERICVWRCTVIHDVGGEPAGVVCSGEDVTQQRSLEQALRQSEERIQIMMDNVKEDEFFMMDRDGYIVSWIARARDERTYRANEVLGEHFSRFYPVEDYQAGKPMRVLERAEREGRYEGEEARVRKDGSVSRAYVIVTAIRDDTNTLLGFSNITRYLPHRLHAGRGLEIPEWHFSDVM